MNWEELRERLESVWGVTPETATMPLSEWNRLSTDGRRARTDGGDWFMWRREGGDVWAFRLPGLRLTERECRLVELLVEAVRGGHDRKPAGGGAAAEEERQAYRLREWLWERLEFGAPEPAEPPEPLAGYLGLEDPKVPFLLYAEHTGGRRVGFAEFRKLLESFFSAKIPLVPLTDREWLMFGPVALVADGTPGTDDDAGSAGGGGRRGDADDALTAVGEALYEMVASESIGECHVAVGRPVASPAALAATVAELRETLALGRVFRIGHNVHAPWHLRLERLLAAVPHPDKRRYVDDVLPEQGRVLEPDMLATLERFFEWDCNVSETAKKLYVHRNTLLYRLDKFRQETGLDVRSFRHAVQVYVALLLYKATKKD